MACDRSHQTVAFCFRIKATYEVGLFVATDLPDVDRLGMLALEFEPVVLCRCMFCEGGLEGGLEIEDGVEGGT